MYIFVLSSLILLITFIEQQDYVMCYERIRNKCVVLINQIKEKLTPYAINIGYNLLYGGSVCQIQFNKCHRCIKKIINPYIKEFKNNNKNNNNNIGKMLIKVDKNGEYVSYHKQNDQPNKDDSSFIFLYHKPSEENEYVNIVIFTEFPKTLDYIETNYIETKIKFMMIELEHENNKYSIELRNKDYNYYIVNNSLNQNFFKYYLKNVHKAAINETKFDYIVTIIDHNVNFIYLLPHQYIVFHENDYTVHSINNSDIDDKSSNSDTNKSDDFVNLDVEVKT